MPKRPSLFAAKAAEPEQVAAPALPPAALTAQPATAAITTRPPSRAGKRVLSLYLDPVAWKQLRVLALEEETTTQALGEEAVNLLFSSRRLNRSA